MSSLAPKSRKNKVGGKCTPGLQPHCVGGSKFRRKQASFILPDMVISEAGAHASEMRVQRKGGNTLSNVKCVAKTVLDN